MITQAKPPYWAPYKSYILLYYGKTHPLTSLKSVSFFFPPLLGNKEWSLLNLFPWSQLQSDPLLPWSLVPLLLPFSLHTGVHFLSAIMQWTDPTPPLSWWWGTYNPGYEASLCQLALWTAPTVVNTIYFARAKYAANTLLRWHISPRATTSAPGNICRGTSGPFHQCQVNRLLFSMAELESWLPHIWPQHSSSVEQNFATKLQRPAHGSEVEGKTLVVKNLEWKADLLSLEAGKVWALGLNHHLKAVT